MEYYFLTGWSSSQLVDWPLTQMVKASSTPIRYFIRVEKSKNFNFFFNFLIFLPKLGLGQKMAKRVLNHDEEPNNRVSSKKKFTATKFSTQKIEKF